jgi:hypothetical protein
VQWLAFGAIWKHATAIPVAVSLGGDLRKSDHSSPVVSGRMSVAENDKKSGLDRRWSPLLGMNVLWAVSSAPQLIQPKGCSKTSRDTASAVRLLASLVFNTPPSPRPFARLYGVQRPSRCVREVPVVQRARAMHHAEVSRPPNSGDTIYRAWSYRAKPAPTAFGRFAKTRRRSPRRRRHSEDL